MDRVITKKFSFPCNTELTVGELEHCPDTIDIVISDQFFHGTLLVPPESVDLIKSDHPFRVKGGVLVSQLKLRMWKTNLKRLQEIIHQTLIEIETEDQNETHFHT